MIQLKVRSTNAFDAGALTWSKNLNNFKVMQKINLYFNFGLLALYTFYM